MNRETRSALIRLYNRIVKKDPKLRAKRVRTPNRRIGDGALKSV